MGGRALAPLRPHAALLQWETRVLLASRGCRDVETRGTSLFHTCSTACRMKLEDLRTILLLLFEASLLLFAVVTAVTRFALFDEDTLLLTHTWLWDARSQHSNTNILLCTASFEQTSNLCVLSSHSPRTALAVLHSSVALWLWLQHSRCFSL